MEPDMGLTKEDLIRICEARELAIDNLAAEVAGLQSEIDRLATLSVRAADMMCSIKESEMRRNGPEDSLIEELREAPEEFQKVRLP